MRGGTALLNDGLRASGLRSGEAQRQQLRTVTIRQEQRSGRDRLTQAWRIRARGGAKARAFHASAAWTSICIATELTIRRRGAKSECTSWFGSRRPVRFGPRPGRKSGCDPCGRHGNASRRRWCSSPGFRSGSCSRPSSACRHDLRFSWPNRRGRFAPGHAPGSAGSVQG